MNVILVRHAEAAPGQPDELRPLTPAGRRVAQKIAERVGGLHPAAVLSSPLLRARETATPIAEVAGVELVVDDRLAPGATVDGLREAVEGRGELVVVVGHQPDCTEIVAALTAIEPAFPPGGLYEVEL